MHPSGSRCRTSKSTVSYLSRFPRHWWSKFCRLWFIDIFFLLLLQLFILWQIPRSTYPLQTKGPKVVFWLYEQILLWVNSCQFDTNLYIAGKRKFRLRNCLHQTSLCLGDIFKLLIDTRRSNAIPRQICRKGSAKSQGRKATKSCSSEASVSRPCL